MEPSKNFNFVLHVSIGGFLSCFIIDKSLLLSTLQVAPLSSWHLSWIAAALVQDAVVGCKLTWVTTSDMCFYLFVHLRPPQLGPQALFAPGHPCVIFLGKGNNFCRSFAGSTIRFPGSRTS